MSEIYTLLTEKGEYGRFKGGSPIKACRKIFAKLCRMSNIEGEIARRIRIKNIETNKIYSYDCVRLELENPKELKFGTVYYEYSIKKSK